MIIRTVLLLIVWYFHAYPHKNKYFFSFWELLQVIPGMFLVGSDSPVFSDLLKRFAILLVVKPRIFFVKPRSILCNSPCLSAAFHEGDFREEKTDLIFSDFIRIFAVRWMKMY